MGCQDEDVMLFALCEPPETGEPALGNVEPSGMLLISALSFGAENTHTALPFFQML
jgi:hypothetical protein